MNHLDPCIPTAPTMIPESISTPAAPHLPGYTLLEPLYIGSRTVVYRAMQTGRQHPVAIKLLRRDYPSFSELVQFRNQYTVAKNLPIPGIVQPLSLEPFGNGYALVMEDGGGVSLGKYLQQHSLNVADILAIALQLTDILHELHQHRVVHKDIKPDNILIVPESKTIKLIDFSIASLLPKETQELQDPNILEGTLAYLAPEQTGRMNRGIDYRADFYALGVTLYQLFSGQLPFVAEEPLELIHCHIAKAPVPVDRVNPNIPAPIAAIVSKLMAKNAEDRYQSALGAKRDLEQCWQQLQATGKIEPFEIGQQDRCDRFLIPEKLYGRDAEVQTLLETFDRVARGTTELMLVAGFSGIGKTVVINEVHKPIARQKGYFIKGKFDQFNRNLPLSAFLQAFRSLLGQLLGQSDRALERWKSAVLEAVGDNGQVLIEVLPELEQLIGSQPEVPQLSGSAAQNRFNLLFQKFIAVFTTAEHPLTLFLDDLQWADAASLNLIEVLMGNSEGGYLLLLGAYRDNEVNSAHPLMLALDAIQQGIASRGDLKRNAVGTITLQPLDFSSLNRLIADALQTELSLARPLTELVMQKTLGNPFFATQFLQGLYEEGCITFNADFNGWQCDLARVRKLALTDDIIEFMLVRLRKLPEASQNILKLAACLGNRFDLTTLALISDESELEVATDLWRILQEGWVIPESETYKFFQTRDRLARETRNLSVGYRFLHDRIQQAAYQLIARDRRAALHYQIGRHLLEKMPSERQADWRFEIVNHLNYGIESIATAAEKEELARLNLEAGRKAKAATAYKLAADYYRIARSLIASKTWETDYKRHLEVYTESVEITFLESDFVGVDRLAEHVLQNTRTFIDGAKIYEIKAQAFIAQNQLDETIQLGLTFLEKLGLTLPNQVSQTEIEAAFSENNQLLQTTAIEEIAEFGLIEDPHQEAIVRMITIAGLAMYIANPSLLMLAVAKQVNLCIRYGNTSTSADAYATYGLFLCGELGDIEQGYRFGKLAVRVLEKLQALEIKSLVYVLVNGFIKHWQDPYQSTLADLKKAYEYGLETGDFQNAALSGYCYCAHLFICEDSLVETQKAIQRYLQAAEAIQQMGIVGWLLPFLQSTQRLLEPSETPGLLCESEELEREKLEEYHQASDRTGIFLFAFHKCYLAYLLGENALALQQAQIAREYLDGVTGQAVVPAFYFCEALILLAQPESEPWQEQLQADRAALKNWATHAPENLQHRCDLIEAESRAKLSDRVAALEAYDRAIAGAKEQGFIQEEALANELAARFYLDWGKEKVAAGYLQEAYYGYSRWGAKAKVDELERRYPHLLRPLLQPAVLALNPLETLASMTIADSSISTQTSTRADINTLLDFTAVLKAAQNLASTLELDELLEQLTQIILQYSGGDRCLLILPDADESWQIRAIAETGAIELCAQPLEDSTELPSELIHYVKRTRETVIVNDRHTDLPIASDNFERQRPESALCLPLLDRGNLAGILYLQNQTTSHVFSRDRLFVLNFLSTQAAIALENARLYQQSQTYAQRLEQSLQTLQLTQAQLRKDEQMMQKQALALVQLSESQAIGQGHLQAAFEELTAVTACILEVERISIWLFNEGATQLECVDLFHLSTRSHSRGFVFEVTDYPVYFSTMKSQPILPVDDTFADPRTSEFKEGYLDAFNIVSMLDSSFFMNGEIAGVICCEQVGEKRVWKQSEQNFIRSAANLIALTLECNQRDRKTQTLKAVLSDLEQSQLQIIQSEKMASLGNLMAGVAHEINNPLGFLKGSLNNLQNTFQDLWEHLELYQQYYPNPAAEIEDNAEEIALEFLRTDIPKSLQSMKGATDRIQAISNSLRSFSRADTEYPVCANLQEGIDSTLAILKYRLKANERRPEIQVFREYGELPQIECFPGQLNQVFMNILANAIDMFDEIAQQSSFTELQKHPQTIVIQTILTDSDTFEIRIRDNGKGISEEVKPRIFEHLFTTKGVGKGTGLGLAIARQIIVEKHGGSLEVQSELGQGTEFCLRLPRCLEKSKDSIFTVGT